MFHSLHSQQLWQLIAFSPSSFTWSNHVAVKHTRAALVVALIWTVNGFISSMRLWNRNAFYFTVAVTTLLCLLGSFVAYWRILRVVWRHQTLIHCQESVRACGKQAEKQFLMIGRYKCTIPSPSPTKNWNFQPIAMIIMNSSIFTRICTTYSKAFQGSFPRFIDHHPCNLINILLKLLDKSSGWNKQNHNSEGGLDTRSLLAQILKIFLLR